MTSSFRLSARPDQVCPIFGGGARRHLRPRIVLEGNAAERLQGLRRRVEDGQVTKEL